jgi:hypothetical protein
LTYFHAPARRQGLRSEYSETVVSSDDVSATLHFTRPRKAALGVLVALCTAGVAAFFELGTYFWIAVGSALGGVARYWFSGVARC